MLPPPDPSGPATRLLGLSIGLGSTGAAARRLLQELDPRYPVIGSVHPGLSPVFDALIKLRHFNPDRKVWRARAGFNDATFQALTSGAERELRRLEGEYDVIFQFQTVFAPGELRARRPFVVYTDNIISLTERFYPAWASLDAEGFRHWRELEAAICRSASYVLAWSDFLGDAMVVDYGCEPERVLRVGAGANILLPSLEGRRWDSATALFVGSNFTIKGGEVLLAAWRLVRERLPQARLVVVGPPRPPAGADLDGVEWRGHVADRAELTRLFEAASVFAMPSLFEAWGHVFLEAMGCGLPCIGTTRGAMPELIAGEETGLLVEPGEPEQLAEALVRLLADPALAERWGRRGYEIASTRHRWSDVVERIAPALEAATQKPPPEPQPLDLRASGALGALARRGGRARWEPAS